MNQTHTFPSSWDADWIIKQGGVISMYSLQQGNPMEGASTLHYPGDTEAFEKISAIIDTYPETYASEVLRPKVMADLAAKRWDEQQATTFNGQSLLCDDVTISRITAAVLLMDCDPEAPQARRWKTGPNSWETLDRDALVTMGSAIAAHLQACFDHEEELQAAILAAVTVDDFAGIDITAGWPS